jgi:hypothetical protein
MSFLIYTCAVCVPHAFQISPAPYLWNCSTHISLIKKLCKQQQINSFMFTLSRRRLIYIWNMSILVTEIPQVFFKTLYVKYNKYLQIMWLSFKSCGMYGFIKLMSRTNASSPAKINIYTFYWHYVMLGYSTTTAETSSRKWCRRVLYHQTHSHWFLYQP